MPNDRQFWIRIVLYAIFVALISYTHYFTLRHESSSLILSYLCLFLIYLFLLKCDITNWKEIFTIAILVRLSLFFGLPQLSDDFYRFIWDGHLLAAGINPFEQTPEFYVNSKVNIEGLSNNLYQHLNSKNYFTIYPPISQFIFWLSIKLDITNSFFGNVTIIRIIILISEIGSLLLIKRLLIFHKLDQQKILIYALNPLVILELTGNLHFEAVMIFFLLLTIYTFYKSNNTVSAFAIAASIATKLVPLMLLPVFIRKHHGYFQYFVIVGLGLIIFFTPIFSVSFIQGISGSLSLFFQNFEFNGGLFFLIREIGFYTKGYDLISSIGPIMSLIAFILILWISIFKTSNKTKFEDIFTIIISIQLLFATTVHPWYIIPLIAFSSLTKFTFPLIWSFFIFLTYIGYTLNGYEHPFTIIILEYVIVGTVAFFEIKNYLSLQKLQND